MSLIKKLKFVSQLEKFEAVGVKPSLNQPNFTAKAVKLSSPAPGLDGGVYAIAAPLEYLIWFADS